MIRIYLSKRENLACVFSLVDSRIEPNKNDLEFIDWMGKNKIPFVIVFTKSDKQSKNKTQSNIATFLKVLKSSWEEIPRALVTSAVDSTGRKEVLDFIGNVLRDLEN
jgi:GTP-binding protein